MYLSHSQGKFDSFKLIFRLYTDLSNCRLLTKEMEIFYRIWKLDVFNLNGGKVCAIKLKIIT